MIIKFEESAFSGNLPYNSERPRICLLVSLGMRPYLPKEWITFKIDLESDTTYISEDTFRRICPNKIENSIKDSQLDASTKVRVYFTLKDTIRGTWDAHISKRENALGLKGTPRDWHWLIGSYKLYILMGDII